jgi:nucleotide-binding universal stress UspA family protein
MFEKVLFPTDFSGFSQRMLPCITDIPGVKEVILLYIIDATQSSGYGLTHQQERENAHLIMEEKKAYLEERGLKATTYVEVITDGTMYRKILAIAEREKVSLMVTGTHQKSLFETFMHGSMSYDLLHHMNTQVLILRENAVELPRGKSCEETCPHIFSKVLVPVDFTENSRELLAIVRGMHGISELVLVHVVTEWENSREIENGVANARVELAKIRKDLEQAGFRVAVHIRVANPAENIVSLAEAENVSLILMCARKKDWLEKFLEGSTTFSVVQSAKSPVLILRRGQ